MRTNWITLSVLMAFGCSDASLKTFNAEPTATITSHADGEELLEEASTILQGKVADSDHDEVDLLTTWRVNGEAICEDVTPEDDGTTSCSAILSTGAVTVALEVSDPGRATGSDSISFTVTPNAPPDVSLTDPFEGERYQAGEAIEFKGRVTDEEDAFDVLTVSIESDLQGTLELNTTLNSEGRFSDFGYLDAGTHIITVTATDSGGKTGRDQEEVEVEPANSAPTIASVEITPDPATATDMLSCIISDFADADGDADNSTYEWTVNSTLAGTNETLSDAFVSGDEVVCTVTPSDGEDDGEPMSDSIVISNSAPQIETVEIAPDPAMSTDVLTCTYTGYTDADGHADSSSYGWTINGAAAGTESTLSEGFTVGDEVVCTATPNDGTEDGEPVSDSIIISNTAPEVDSVVITPDEGVNTASTLTCAATFTDADGEELSPAYSWTIAGVDAGDTDTLVLTPETAIPGDEVICTATATDGSGDSASGSDTVSVGNTAPEMLDVIIEPGETITTSTTLTCEAIWTDADGEDLSPTFSWTRDDGTDFGTDPVLVLEPLFATPGDVYTCTATVTDGAGASATGSDSATVGNTPPEIVEVVITPDTGVSATMTLTCIATAEDADGDVPTLTYGWDIEGFDAGTGGTLDLSTTGAVSGETVTCTATATDAIDATDTGTDSVLIENTAPEVDSVTLSPDPVYTNDTITATASTSDAEDDAVTVTYDWYVNDGLVATGTGDTLSGVTTFDKHDEVYVVATPSDGTDDGEAITSDGLTVSNTPPTAPGMSIHYTDDHDGDGYVSVDGGGTDCNDEDPSVHPRAGDIHGDGEDTDCDGIDCEAGYSDDGVYFTVCTEETTQAEADTRCIDAGHDGLTVIHNAEQEATVAALAEAISSSDDKELWLGITDAAEEDFWIDRTGPISYTNWWPGQPAGATGENCAIAPAYADYEWHDVACSRTHWISCSSIDSIDSAADLTCSIDTPSTDADGDPITYDFSWDVDGEGYTDTDTDTHDGDTVPADALGSAETWTCTVTPNDGEEDGEPGSDSYTTEAVSACGSLQFDGSDRVDVSSIPDIEHKVTFEMWFKPDILSGVPAWIDDWYVELCPSGTAGIIVEEYLDGSCADTWSVDTWYHLAGAWDFTTDTTSVWINGTPVGTHPASGTPPDLDALIFGTSSSGGGSYSGLIGGIHLWNRILTDGEVRAHYLEAPALSSPGLVAAWTFHEGSGSTLTDVTGNGFDGVISGATWNDECPDIYGDCWTATHGDSTYAFCPDRLGRDAAEAQCESFGMDLVKITTADENDFVFTEAVDVGGWAHPGAWIGLQDKDLDGTFAWNDGESLDYTQWCGSHPIDPGDRAYVHMELTIDDSPCWAANGSWSIAELEYVCEKSSLDGDGDGYDVGEDCNDSDSSSHPYAGDTYGDGVDSDCDGLDCEAGFHEGTYFTACVLDAIHDSSYASELCADGGYDAVATVTSAAENAFLLDLRPENQYFLIGLSDTESEGSFVWESGLPVTYTDWGGDEPDGGGGEDCVKIYPPTHGGLEADRWGDARCSANMNAFYCEARGVVD